MHSTNERQNRSSDHENIRLTGDQDGSHPEVLKRGDFDRHIQRLEENTEVCIMPH